MYDVLAEPDPITKKLIAVQFVKQFKEWREEIELSRVQADDTE